MTSPPHEDLQPLEKPQHTESPTPSKILSVARLLGKGFQILAMLCLLGLFALVIIKYSPFSPEKVPVGENHPAVGRALTTLTLAPLTGTTTGITSADLSGRVTLINFWGTWCPPCRQEFPHMKALFEEFKNHPTFLFLSVSCGGDSQENIEELRRSTSSFVNSSGAAFPTYADPNYRTRNEIDRIAGFQGYPTTILIDGTRTIRAMWVGYWPGIEKEIERTLKKLLAESQSSHGDSAKP
ncbi:TlpA disulfide reductase family protein [Thermogutta sp.]|uniref:TlpA family protein disulfide reductase n=1 Tax=Thermogutta sp. TaxID=1962930 RepID=UPI0032202B8F